MLPGKFIFGVQLILFFYLKGFTDLKKCENRYGRYIQIVRLLRLLTFMPCNNLYSKREIALDPTISTVRKVSHDLATILSIRVAMLILVLVIIMPYLGYNYNDYSPEAWLQLFIQEASSQNATTASITSVADQCYEFYRRKDPRLLHVTIESPYLTSPYIHWYSAHRTIRSENKLRYKKHFSVQNSLYSVKMQIDNTTPAMMQSVYNILIIVLVIFSLFLFTTSLNNSVHILVIAPLEKTTSVLKNSAMTVLKAIRSAKEENKAKLLQQKRDSGDVNDDDDDPEVTDDDSEVEDEDELESIMLEAMVDKLARIMKHVLPNHSSIEIEQGHIDDVTASWLHHSYSAIASRKVRYRQSIRRAAFFSMERMSGQEWNLDPHVVEQLDTWNFNVLDHNQVVLNRCVMFMFSKLGLLQYFGVNDELFGNFLVEIESRYQNNTYHNYRHGWDVCFTSFRTLTVSQLSSAFTPLEMFSLLIASLSHDVGHLGVNNLFLVKAKNELAIIHNDRSPLENMHCNVLYEVLGQPQTNILKGLTDKQWREARKIMLTIILATDMSFHFGQISKTQVPQNCNILCERN